MKTPPLATLVGLAVAGVAALFIGATALGERLAESEPEVAAMLNRSDVDAHLEMAREYLKLDPPDYASARANAVRGLQADPLNESALLVLAQIAQADGDKNRTGALMELLARTSSRNLQAQAWLLERDVAAGDWRSAMARVDVIFRGQNGAVWVRLADALAPIVTEAKVATPITESLAQRPPWRAWLLPQIVRRTKDVDGLIALYAALGDSPAPPELVELRPFLDRLVRDGLIEDAFVAWVRSLPPERAAKLGHLYNADFQTPVTNTPFDWTFQPVKGAVVRLLSESTSPTAKILAVDFFGGRVPFQHIQHDLLLAPGKYRFKGQERAEALQNERGLRWRIVCTQEPALTLATTSHLKGDVDWRPFSAEFEVPETCGSQRLLLELPARVVMEQEVTGGVRYKDIDVEQM